MTRKLMEDLQKRLLAYRETEGLNIHAMGKHLGIGETYRRFERSSKPVMALNIFLKVVAKMKWEDYFRDFIKENRNL